jgi:hypothetical protein
MQSMESPFDGAFTKDLLKIHQMFPFRIIARQYSMKIGEAFRKDFAIAQNPPDVPPSHDYVVHGVTI